MSRTQNITQDELRQFLHYNLDTGVFTWVNCKGNSRAGTIAGWVEVDGYQRIQIGGRRYPAHRLAWLYVTGKFPPGDIDHISGVRDDNRWANLRAVTPSQNNRNRALAANNTSGVVGVNWSKRHNTWHAKIMSDGVRRHLGYFEDLADAINARKSAERAFGYHPNHGRSAA